MQAALNQKSASLTQLEAQNRDALAQIVKFKSQQAAADQQIGELKASLDQKEKALALAEANLKSCGSGEAEKDQKIFALQKEIQEAQAQIQHLQDTCVAQSDYDALGEEIGKYQEQYEQLTSQLETSKREKAELQEQLEKTTQELAKLKSEMQEKAQQSHKVQEPLSPARPLPESKPINPGPSASASRMRSEEPIAPAQLEPKLGSDQGEDKVFTSENRIICPKCGNSRVKEIPDKSRVIAYIPSPVYGKKFQCSRCKHEWA